MRVISLNVNGIRSACEKGLWSWLTRQNADVICLQELRAHPEQLPEQLTRSRGYHTHFLHADRRGYSGVAVLTRERPSSVQRGLGWADVDSEARYLRVDFERLAVASIYVPSGSSGEERQGFKMKFLDRLAPFLTELKREGKEAIVAGDFNVAHTKLDLANWRGNQKNSGFLPEERAFLDRLYGELGWVDAFRVVQKEPGHYTWWSNRGRAWDKNVGWRLDLQVVTPGLEERVQAATIYTRKRFSDHAPLVIDYRIDP
ncbi:MAG: exodeoxyribonuclease III [Deltaproteobacteria bacterium]|nr:exodeoxyribonuclease III [Deltaproteobacteria bacterium]